MALAGCVNNMEDTYTYFFRFSIYYLLYLLLCSYFFNFGDGSLRNAKTFATGFAKQMKKIRGIFLTYRKWENISGVITLNKHLHSLANRKSVLGTYFRLFGDKAYVSRLTEITLYLEGAPLMGYTFRGLITRSAGALSKFLLNL